MILVALILTFAVGMIVGFILGVMAERRSPGYDEGDPRHGRLVYRRLVDMSDMYGQLPKRTPWESGDPSPWKVVTPSPWQEPRTRGKTMGYNASPFSNEPDPRRNRRYSKYAGVRKHDPTAGSEDDVQ